MKKLFKVLAGLAAAAGVTFFSPIALAQYYPLVGGAWWELQKCVVPAELSFSRDLENGTWVSNRYVRYTANDVAYKFLPPFSKNPEGLVYHGPAHLSNCSGRNTSASSIHALTFRFVATGVFGGSGVGNHFVVLQRAQFPNLYSDGLRDGIGIAMFGKPLVGNGYIFAQRPNNLPGGLYESQIAGTSFAIQDGVVYEVLMRANADEITYQVTNVANPAQTFWRTWRPNVGGVNGNGFAFVMLCKDADSRCEIDQPWRIDIFGISASQM